MTLTAAMNDFEYYGEWQLLFAVFLRKKSLDTKTNQGSFVYFDDPVFASNSATLIFASSAA